MLSRQFFFDSLNEATVCLNGPRHQSSVASLPLPSSAALAPASQRGNESAIKAKELVSPHGQPRSGAITNH